jgi:DNA end-binding protein Ku
LTNSNAVTALLDGPSHNALKDLIKKKQKGEKIARPTERTPSNVVNLMDALRQSVKAHRSGAPQKAVRSQAKNVKNRIEGQREMLLPITGKKGKEAVKPQARTATRRKAG